MQIGIELRIDVTQIDKSRIYVGKKGKYITLTSFVDLENEDKYGNNGFITHKKNKGEEGDCQSWGTPVFFIKMRKLIRRRAVSGMRQMIQILYRSDGGTGLIL